MVVSGALSDYISQEEFKLFYQGLAPIPAVSIAMEIDGATSILVDNKQGVRNLVNHLVETHGYRKIAFIRGPEGHQEADARFEAYVETLAQHNIPFDPNLVAPGEFITESGIAAVELFIDKRQLELDAIIAVDDENALGVLRALRARKLKVPEDIAVVGFDDILEARFATPTLTSVRQPFYDQAKQATKLLLAKLAGKEIPPKIELATKLAIRSSCGCFLAPVIQAGIPPIQSSSKTINTDLPTRKSACYQEIFQAVENILVEAAQKKLAPMWASLILENFLVSAANPHDSVYLKTLKTLLEESITLQIDTGLWQNVISALRQAVYQNLSEELQITAAETLLGQSRVIIGEAMERVQADEMLKNQQRSLITSEVGRSLLSTLDVDEMLEIISETLPELNIHSCYLVLYDGEDQKTDWGKLLFAHNTRNPQEARLHGERFPTRSLLPTQLLHTEDRITRVIEALYFQSDQFGYAIIEIGPKDGSVYASLRRQISSALKGALLLQERRQAEAALETAYKELEAFSYSVSHDLRVPLRTINAYANIMMEDFGAQLPAEARQYLEKIRENTNQMNIFIFDILEYSRLNRKPVNKHMIQLESLVAEALENFPEEHASEQIKLSIGELPACQADPVLLKQVYVNLLSNAFKFTRKRERPHIQIGHTIIDGETAFFVKDNGVGFNMDEANKLFGVFQRLHPDTEYEGTGIGLANVARIIQRHGGRIWVQAEIDQGAAFFFTVEPPQKTG